MRSSIEAQFRGGVVYDWRPEGLHCRLSIPRAQIAAARGARRRHRPRAGRRQPRAASPASACWWSRTNSWSACWSEDILTISAPTVVGPYGRLADGLAAAKAERFDGAILDLNLAGQQADPLADLLLARGVPFVFITGYQRDSIDRRYANVPVLQKPIDAAALEGVLLSLLDTKPLLQAGASTA